MQVSSWHALHCSRVHKNPALSLLWFPLLTSQNYWSDNSQSIHCHWTHSSTSISFRGLQQLPSKQSPCPRNNFCRLTQIATRFCCCSVQKHRCQCILLLTWKYHFGGLHRNSQMFCYCCGPKQKAIQEAFQLIRMLSFPFFIFFFKKKLFPN